MTRPLRPAFFRLITAGVLLLTVSTTSRSQFFAIETEYLRLVYYSKTHEFLTPHIVRSFENSLRFHRSLFDYTPSEKITLILQDFGDFAGGGANTVPFNLVGIGIAPFSYAYETMPPIERMNMMMNHELVHIVTMDKPSPRDRFWRGLFSGKVAPVNEAPLSAVYAYLTSPRWNSPRWFIEGIAVFLETWMGGGLGRALGAYDEMVFRTMVRDSAYFYDVVGLESEGTKVDFQVGANSYLYGTRFISSLALRFGPEKIIEWFRQSDSSRSYFSADFKRVFGSSLDEEWARWIRDEHEWQKDNLARLREFPITRFRPITSLGLGSVSRAFVNPATGKLYAALNYPGQTAHLAEIDLSSGKLRKLGDLRGAALFYVTSLTYDRENEILFYTTDNNAWRDIVSLDVKSGETRILQKDLRTGDLAFCPADRSLWGVRHFNGISTLVQIPYPYTDWKQILSFDYGKDFFDIDISPDGKHVIGALADVTGRQLLVRMETEQLSRGNKSYEILFDFENSTPANFAYTPDGNFLFGTSYYSGVSNVVRYDFGKKEMEWVTNSESGFFRAVPVSQDSLVAFHFTGRGFVPIMIANETVRNVNAIRYLGQAVVDRHPDLRSWSVPPPSPSTMNIDTVIKATGDYSGSGAMKLASLYPIVEGFKDFPAYGLRANFSDPILLHNLDLTISYTPNSVLPANQRLHAAFNYKFWNWKVSATYHGGDFYDLFGPTKTSRKGYSLTSQYHDYLLYDEPEIIDYQIKLGGFAGLERLPDFQNVSTSFDQFYSLNAQLNYHNLTKSLGAVDDETGSSWAIVSHTNLVNGRFFPRTSISGAFGFLLPIHHSSIWLRGSTGYSPGSRMEPFANFYFGGFGNNWVDIGEIRRYRGVESFPGLEINQLGGTTYFKGMAEWDLPPIRFRKFGFQSLYCTWSRIAVFASGLITNPGAPGFRRSAGSIGIQSDFRLVLFSSFESTLSIGYAAAAERNHRLSKELMVSLKILR